MEAGGVFDVKITHFQLALVESNTILVSRIEAKKNHYLVHICFVYGVGSRGRSSLEKLEIPIHLQYW